MFCRFSFFSFNAFFIAQKQPNSSSRLSIEALKYLSFGWSLFVWVSTRVVISTAIGKFREERRRLQEARDFKY